MNQPIDVPNQNAIQFSTQLGALAAERPAAQPALSGRLSAILEHLRQKERAREQLNHKIRATHFIMAD